MSIRTELKELLGRKVIIQGRISKYGYRGGPGTQPFTVCISDAYVTDVDDISKTYSIDHIWIRISKKFQNLNATQNDFIQFEGIVSEYVSSNGLNYTVSSNKKFKKLDIKYVPDRKKRTN